MRFRRRRNASHRGRPRPGMKGDWIILIHTDCLLALPEPQDCLPDDFSLDHVAPFSLVDGPDVREKQDALTIVRMVGELSVFAVPQVLSPVPNPSYGLIQVDEHIVLGTTDDTGAVAILDPRRDLTMESDNLMWRRRTHIALECPAFAGATGFCAVSYESTELGSPHLDIRVKRRIREGSELIYAVASSVVSTLGPLSVTQMIDLKLNANLRGYVKF